MSLDPLRPIVWAYSFVPTTIWKSRVFHFSISLGFTTASGSLFAYDQGKSYQTYYNPSYTPVFLDAGNLTFENATLEEEAKRVCGSSLQCLFDIRTTGKVTIGIVSRNSVVEFLAIVNETKTVGKWMNAWQLKNMIIHEIESHTSPSWCNPPTPPPFFRPKKYYSSYPFSDHSKRPLIALSNPMIFALRPGQRS